MVVRSIRMKLQGLKAVIFDVHRTLVDDSGFPREKIWKLLQESGANFSMDEYYHLYDELTHQLFQWDKIIPFIKIREIHKDRLRKFYTMFQVDRDIDEDVKYLWDEMETSRLYPEVPEVLRTIAKHLWVMARPKKPSRCSSTKKAPTCL